MQARQPGNVATHRSPWRHETIAPTRSAAQPAGMGQSFHLRVGNIRTFLESGPVGQSAARSDPQRPIAVHQQRTDKVVGSPSAEVNASTALPRMRFSPSGVPIHRSPFGAAARDKITFAQENVAHGIGSRGARIASVSRQGVEAASAGPDPQLARRAFHHSRRLIGSQASRAPMVRKR